EEHRPLLAKLLPSLGTERSPQFKNPAEERAATMRALSSWLRGLATARPLVIVLEDLHWADNATLEHLNVVIRALRGTKGLVLGSYRSNEMDRLSVAFQTVDEGESEKRELAPLTQEQVGTLIALALRGF